MRAQRITAATVLAAVCLLLGATAAHAQDHDQDGQQLAATTESHGATSDGDGCVTASYLAIN
ncbi:hypothetical protein [Streptomyces sp. 058-1L]|uniref:hypothetical protein n=1 Tax=Streptomyces sp. 058-1L TaxID=2789266 RepID=UPI00397F80EF